MRILATGFEPFGGEEVNPSWMAVSRLSEDVKGAEIIKNSFRSYISAPLRCLKAI